MLGRTRCRCTRRTLRSEAVAVSGAAEKFVVAGARGVSVDAAVEAAVVGDEDVGRCPSRHFSVRPIGGAEMIERG